MNTITDTFLRDATCALAAGLITFVLGTGFVTSTEQVPGVRAAGAVAATTTAPRWFGQPEPAVLVD